MKRKNIMRFFIQIAIYTCIVIALYLLYSPLNKDPMNGSSSSAQFVYQQF